MSLGPGPIKMRRGGFTEAGTGVVMVFSLRASGSENSRAALQRTCGSFSTGSEQCVDASPAPDWALQARGSTGPFDRTVSAPVHRGSSDQLPSSLPAVRRESVRSLPQRDFDDREA